MTSGSPLAGTGGLLRLYLRRDRIVLPLWVFLLSVPLSAVYVASTSSVYPDESQRAGLVASIMASPAQRALYGNIYNDSLGATALWKASAFHALIGVALILTVIRHTRGDEESGRSDLIESTVVGRFAGLTAALLLGFGAAVATGIVGTVGLLFTAVPAAGSVAFGAALTGSGLVFAALAAVAAQVTVSARTARGMSFAVLGAAFALRAVGDAGAGSLSWCSPLGWSLQVRPYAGERWWVLALHGATAFTLTALAYGLRAQRDLGGGLIAERRGRADAPGWLAGPLGLAWRLQRGALMGWGIGLALYALLAGSIVHGIDSEIGDSPQIREIIARFGGTSAVEAAFIAISFSFIGAAASAQGISATLRLHSEESAGRAEPVLAGSVSRMRWAASHLAFAVGGTAVTLLTAGVVAGTAYGAAAGDLGGKIGDAVCAAAVQLPAVWLMAAMTLALVGLLPRFAPAAWGVFVGFLALFLLGSVSGMPQFALELSPYAHVPRVPGEPLRSAPILWLLGAAVTLDAIGFAALRRRDIR